MKGLDLRKLKKISSDDKMTVFKHDMGHEIKIAHHGLSPKMMEELKGIPLHGKTQKMAEGGNVKKYANAGEEQPDPEPNQSPDDTSKPQAPVNIYVGGQPAQSQNKVPVPAENVPGVSDPGPPATTGTNLNAAPSSEQPLDVQPIDPNSPEAQAPASPQGATPPTPSLPSRLPSQPAAPTVPTAAQILTQPMSAQDVLAHLTDETGKLHQDFMTGAITPKTYSQLFANKDLPAKIGSIFGLLASAVGGGLSHGADRVLNMMNKEIDNDLEAQKSTRTNQYNALNLAEAHYRDQIAGNYTKAQSAQINAGLPAVTTNATKQMYEFGLEQHINKMAGMVPENTQAGQNARAAAGVVSNAITAQQAQRNQQVAQQLEANGQQIQQQGQSNAPQGGGEILAADTTPQKVFGLTSKYSSLSDADKGLIDTQYQQARGAEAALSQIRKLMPELRKNATSTDIYGQSLATLPVVGHASEQFLDNITGGNQQRQFKTGKDAITGYITSVLTDLGMTPTEAADKAAGFMPAKGDDDVTYNGRVDKLTDKITSMARAKFTKLDGLGLLK